MAYRQQAQEGLGLLKEAILGYVRSHAEGVRHAQLVEDLALKCDFEGSGNNYLSYSVLGLLQKEGKVESEKIGRDRMFKATVTPK